mmetsp:Transcript_45286/g.105753  ORF Transcript_45286/g.105753 Transcript_45286/m.105753 type:complete len:202 (-) Transcript_45286:536-1141(-)
MPMPIVPRARRIKVVRVEARLPPTRLADRLDDGTELRQRLRIQQLVAQVNVLPQRRVQDLEEVRARVGEALAAERLALTRRPMCAQPTIAAPSLALVEKEPRQRILVEVLAALRVAVRAEEGGVLEEALGRHHRSGSGGLQARRHIDETSDASVSNDRHLHRPHHLRDRAPARRARELLVLLARAAVDAEHAGTRIFEATA